MDIGTKLLTILPLVVAPLFCWSQTKIENIDKSVQAIRSKLSSFSKTEKINSKQGTRIVFMKENDLKLVAIKALEPTMAKNVEWYYIDGQLAYCETNWVDTKTTNNIFNEKCYLDSGHLISWTNSRDKTIDPSSADFKKMDLDLVAYGVKIKEDALK